MTFDAKEYRNRVLSQYARSKEPILRKALGELKQNPGLAVPSRFDLAEFYDIPVNLSDAAVGAQIDSVASAIKAAVQKPGGSRQPLDFHELIVARNPDMKSAAFWAAVRQRGAQQGREALEEFGANVATDFSALGVVTSKQLRDLAKKGGVPESVTDAELARVFEGHNVTVVAEMPRTAAPAQVLKEISNGLRKTSARSVLSVIFIEEGEPQTFSILDGFRGPAGGAPLSLATVSRASEYAQRLAETDEHDAFRKILSAINTAARTDTELSDIVLSHFIELGRQTFAEIGNRRGALLAFVDRTGIDAKDAGRILLDVTAADAAPHRTYVDVQSLVAAGALKEARRLYEAIFAESLGSETDAQKQARTALEGAERRVEELRRRADMAQTAGDLETATKALNEAVTLCSDDEMLTAAARALPPAAPIRFFASVPENARTTTLSWEPGFGSTDDVTYRVFRTTGRPPRNNADGTLLGASIRDTTFEDPEPPVAVAVFYSVSASRGGGSSPAAIAEVMVLPPVTDVIVTSDQSTITLRWSAPPESSTIEIVQSAPDGSNTMVSQGSQSGATSAGLRMGSTYTYLITAIYTGATGDRLRSATVRTTGVPRGAARPASELTISANATTASTAEVSAEWMSVEGYAVEVWHYSQQPTWRPGSRVPMAEVRAQGTQLAGRAFVNGEREGVRGTTGPGLRHYVAVTRDGDFALTGVTRSFGSAPVVQNVRSERFGDELVLSWDWPGPEYRIRVRWDGPTQGERTISMNEYRSQGGCRVLLGAAGGTVRVASLAGEGGEDWASLETSITVDGASAAVDYDVDFHKRFLGSPSGASVTFSIPSSSAPLDVVVVGHFSKFMPFDATQGSVLARASVSAASPRVDVALPRGKGPVWVRAFTITPGARLNDPRPNRMKVD